MNKPHADGLVALGLLLELGHAPQLAEGGRALEQPVRPVCSGTWLWANTVQISGSRPLAKSHAAVSRVRAAQAGGVLGEGEGVQVDDAEDRVRLVLVGHPLAKGAEVVADVRRTGRLHPRKDPFHRVQDIGT